MKKVFLDTNVLIDFLCGRNDYEDAAKILTIGKNGGIKLYATVLTMANIVYILRKVLKGKQLYDALKELSSNIELLSLTKENYESALILEADDFEDALQYYSAVSNECEVIVTRNCKDFSFAKCSVISPSDFLKNCFC